MTMNFELLDRYLLESRPGKAEVVKTLLSQRPGGQAAQAYYEGIKMLGPRTPDLALIALRLVLAGRKADDDEVVAMRKAVDAARAGDPAAKTAYRRLLGEAESEP